MQNRLLFGPAATHRSVQDLLAEVRQLLEKDWLELREHERGLARREVELAERAGALAERQREVETALQELAAQRSELQLLQSAVSESRQGLVSLEEEARRQQLALETRLNALAEREARLLPREAALVEREQALARREEDVSRQLAQFEAARTVTGHAAAGPNPAPAGEPAATGRPPAAGAVPTESEGAAPLLTGESEILRSGKSLVAGSETRPAAPAVLRAERAPERRPGPHAGTRAAFPGMLIAGGDGSHPLTGGGMVRGVNGDGEVFLAQVYEAKDDAALAPFREAPPEDQE